MPATTESLRERAATLREAGDRSGAREAEAQATVLALAEAQRDVLDAEIVADAAREARAQVIHDAIDAGWSYSRVARATGLSHQRVRQLVLGDRGA